MGPTVAVPARPSAPCPGGLSAALATPPGLPPSGSAWPLGGNDPRPHSPPRTADPDTDARSPFRRPLTSVTKGKKQTALPRVFYMFICLFVVTGKPAGQGGGGDPALVDSQTYSLCYPLNLEPTLAFLGLRAHVGFSLLEHK